MPRVRKYYLLRGRVQGVGFRWFAADLCSSRGVTGWVRNLPGGAVELEAQGEAEDLASIEQDLKTGNPLAHVAEMQQQELPLAQDEKDFDVKF